MRVLAVTAGAMALMLAAGCRQDMQDQPKMIPQRESQFFADGRSARPQVLGTVARGQLHEDGYFYTGLLDGKEQDTMPFPATMEVLERGQERFNVYCTPCHSRVGNGLGMIVERGYKPAGNFHDAKRIHQPLSHYVFVMSNGYGAMPDYASQLPPADRWAVAAYIRALQLSQNATQSDVPAGTQIENLDVSAWPLPSTAVQAIPHKEVVAGAPATPASAATQNPKNSGSSKPSNGAATPPASK
jgi:mono/diheme cytochrome c family protein